MVSDIGPQSPSTPNCFCVWSWLIHLSSRTLRVRVRVQTGLSKDCGPRVSQVHSDARVSDNRDGGNIHRKKVSESQPGRPPQEVRRQTRNPFPYIRIRTLSQIKEAPRGCGRRTAVDWSAMCQSKKSRMDC